jgi:hypothetical protein
MGIYDQFTDAERVWYDSLLAFSRRYVTRWYEWEELVAAIVAHMRETGADPELVNGVWEAPTGLHYVGDENAAVYFAVARQRLAPTLDA